MGVDHLRGFEYRKSTSRRVISLLASDYMGSPFASHVVWLPYSGTTSTSSDEVRERVPALLIICHVFIVCVGVANVGTLARRVCADAIPRFNVQDNDLGCVGCVVSLGQ